MLTWCIYFLATYQDVQNKVRTELVTVLGSSTEVTVEMANKMKYVLVKVVGMFNLDISYQLLVNV